MIEDYTNDIRSFYYDVIIGETEGNPLSGKF